MSRRTVMTLSALGLLCVAGTIRFWVVWRVGPWEITADHASLWEVIEAIPANVRNGGLWLALKCAVSDNWLSAGIALFLGANFGDGYLIYRRRRRVDRGRCAECGYDLRASKARCPECGRPVGGE